MNTKSLKYSFLVSIIAAVFAIFIWYAFPYIDDMQNPLYRTITKTIVLFGGLATIQLCSIYLVKNDIDEKSNKRSKFLLYLYLVTGVAICLFELATY